MCNSGNSKTHTHTHTHTPVTTSSQILENEFGSGVSQDTKPGKWLLLVVCTSDLDFFFFSKSPQSCPTLCDPIDGRPPGSPVPGILQARTRSGLPFPSPMHESESEATQSCPTLSDPMDCSLPGSSIHGIFQARVLEWGAIAFSADLDKK